MNALKVCPQCGTEYPANARFCEVDGTALRSAAQGNDLVGSIVADRYHVMKKLGEGGMGQVYLAEHVKMGRKSALKVMHPGMVADVDAISRFNREAANASRISHPNVAAVYDFGETPDGLIYLAMEFVDGPPLTSVIEQQGALQPKRAAEIARQTSEALAVAHDMGIVHRDLKPDNIMIARTRDGGDLVKVVDFGIAKAAGSEAQKVTKTGLVVGTPEYMSPEQLAGDKLDGRSDIYSLGLVAYNMLTGKLPFPSESAQESMIMRLTDAPKPLGEMRPDVTWPADVQAVMDTVLARDANQRYQTATEFGRALYQAVDRMPESVAADAGTQVMGAVPATRVAPAPHIDRVTQTAAPAKKNGLALGLAGFAVVAALGVGTWVTLRGKSPTPSNGAANTPAGSSGAGVATPQGQPAGGGAAQSTSDRSKTGKTVPLSRPVSATNAGGGDVGPALATLEVQDTLSERSARATLTTTLPNLMPRLRLGTDSIRAALIAFSASAKLNDTQGACAALKTVEARSTGTSYEGHVHNLLLGCGE